MDTDEGILFWSSFPGRRLIHDINWRRVTVVLIFLCGPLVTRCARVAAGTMLTSFYWVVLAKYWFCWLCTQNIDSADCAVCCCCAGLDCSFKVWNTTKTKSSAIRMHERLRESLLDWPVTRVGWLAKSFPRLLVLKLCIWCTRNVVKKQRLGYIRARSGFKSGNRSLP